MRVWFAFTTLMLCCWGTTAEAAQLRIIASPGVSGVFSVLGPKFEQATGYALSLEYGLNPAQKQYIEAGNFDLAIVPSVVLDSEIKEGRISADTRTPIASVKMGVGVRAGAPKPDLGSVEAFKRAMLAAKSVSYVTNEPAGEQVSRDFETLGIAQPMKQKTKPAEKVAQLWQAVATGDAELGFGFSSNIVSAPGVEFAGLFPDELQYSVVITAGVGTSAREAGAAKRLINYLLSPEAATVLKAKGLVPSLP